MTKKAITIKKEVPVIQPISTPKEQSGLRESALKGISEIKKSEGHESTGEDARLIRSRKKVPGQLEVTNESILQEAKKKLQKMTNIPKADLRGKITPAKPIYTEILVPPYMSLMALAEDAYRDIPTYDIPHLGGRSLLISTCMELNEIYPAKNSVVKKFYNAKAMNMEFEIGAGTLVDTMLSGAIRVDKVLINTVWEKDE